MTAAVLDWMVAKNPWEQRHPRAALWVHAASGTWLLFLTGLLVRYRRQGRWPAVLIPSGVLHLLMALALARYLGQTDPE